MKKRTLLIGIGLAAVAAVALALVFDLPGLLVNKAPNEAAALRIATDVAKKKYSEDFLDQYEVKVMYDSGANEWVVYWGKPGYFGGGGPCIHINKSTGDITRMYLQK